MTHVTIGVDGGGTKTKMVALDSRGHTLAEAEGGSINYYFMPMDQAVENFGAVLSDLNLPGGTVVEAIGVGDPAVNDAMETETNRLFQSRVKEVCACVGSPALFFKSDVFMALYGLTKGGPGALLISGTGSMGAALGSDGSLSTAGGWGFPTNDDGSGYYIAVEAIKTAYAALDGVGPSTQLEHAIPAFWGKSSLYELVDLLNGGQLQKTHVAALAPCVTQCARSGDAAAQAVLDKAAGHLAGYAVALCKRIGGGPVPVGMFGGVFLHDEFVREGFCQRVRRECGVTPGFPDCPPQQGAALFAFHQRKKLFHKKVDLI